MPQQPIENLVNWVPLNNIVLAELALRLKAQLLEDAARGSIFIMNKRNQFAQRSLTKDPAYQL